MSTLDLKLIVDEDVGSTAVIPPPKYPPVAYPITDFSEVAPNFTSYPLCTPFLPVIHSAPSVIILELAVFCSTSTCVALLA